MPSFISKQPNGLYCRFSTVTDSITHYNMTAEEYIEYCAEKAKETARWILEHDLEPFEKVEGNFCDTIMTRDEFDKILKKMKDPIKQE